MGVCLRNCAQCKKMYGSYFEGQMCADSCVKFKGKIIPGTLNDETRYFPSVFITNRVLILSEHIKIIPQLCVSLVENNIDCEDIGSIAPFLNKF